MVGQFLTGYYKLTTPIVGRSSSVNYDWFILVKCD